MTFFALPGKSVVSKSPNEMETNKVNQENRAFRQQLKSLREWEWEKLDISFLLNCITF